VAREEASEGASVVAAERGAERERVEKEE